MEKKNFWKTRAGGLTVAFLIIMAAFVLILIGCAAENDLLCSVAFLMIVAAMLYAPVNKYILKKK